MFMPRGDEDFHPMGCSPRSPGHYRLDTMGDADPHRGVPHPASSGHGEVNLGELGSYMQHMPSCISTSWARIRLAADVRRAAQASSRAGMSGSSLDPTTRSPPAGTCSLRLPVRATRFMSIHACRDGGGIACSAVRRRVETCATKTASKCGGPGPRWKEIPTPIGDMPPGKIIGAGRRRSSPGHSTHTP